MQVFRVYQHKTKGYKAVPMGFSVSAFITSFIWAAANSLWSKALTLVLGFALMAAAAIAGKLLNTPLLTLAGVGGVALLPLWAGIQGQHWIANKLEHQGYSLKKRITAASASKAIAAVKRVQEQATAAKDAPKRQQEASFGKDFRDIRDNTPANSNQQPPVDFRASPWKKR